MTYDPSARPLLAASAAPRPRASRTRGGVTEVDAGAGGAAFAGLHVALVMDGNGRWAARRGLPRVAGHRAGARSVREVVAAAAGLGIGTLTLYALSSDNWRRPPAEVEALLRLLRGYLAAEARRCADRGIRLRLVGRRDRLPEAVLRAAEEAERATAAGGRLLLRIAVDYSARDAIARAAALAGGAGELRERFPALLAQATGGGPVAPDADLLVRTGGEQRLSDFLLWECAYAELYFTATPWPEFGAGELAAALAWFRGRERRFGGLACA
jgi:undecaprenyl diphosphate synthase